MVSRIAENAPHQIMHISSNEDKHPYIIRGHLLIALPTQISMGDEIILAEMRQCHIISVRQRDRPLLRAIKYTFLSIEATLTPMLGDYCTS